MAIGWTRIQSGKTAKKERRGILRKFGWRGVRKFYGARRKAVSWSTHGWPGGILGENLSISKDGAKVRRTFRVLQIFWQENAKKVHFGGFWGQK